MPTSIRLRANAKLNLFLRLLGLRADGFHEIETIFQTISLADELAFTVDAPEGVKLEVAAGSRSMLPGGEGDLIVLAARLLEPHARSPSGVRIRVRKDIPVGGGLGGGSADAAAALVALNELWACGLSHAELARLGADLGSDIPYLLSGGMVLATGRGERLTPIGSAPELWFVLGISDVPLLTGDVYAAWDGLERSTATSRRPLTAALGGNDPAAVATFLHNDLEAAALRLRPELDARRRALVDAGAMGARVSGSGPTVFALARDREDARRLADAVGGVFDRVEVARSRPRAIERLS